MKIKSIILLLASVALVGCGGSGSTSSATDACTELSSDTFSCDGMLNDLVADGVLPIVQDLETKLNDLDSAVATYCSDDSKLPEAKAAWTAVMAPLQQLQVMNFGPNTSSDSGLLPLYDWQTAHPVNIDTAIAQNALAAESKLSVIDNEKDLVAVEYVLFDVAAVQIGASENPNTTAWRAGKTDEEIQQDRCDYANLVTSSLKAHGESLNEAWQQYDVLASSSTSQAAANKVAEALFYIDKITKDEKIKTVLPQADDNESAFDASVLESQFAKQSKEAILNNLIGARIILTLTDTKDGLDGYLIAAGQQDVAVDMVLTLAVAISNLNLMTGDAFDAVNNANDEAACKNYSSGSLSYTTANSDIELFCALQHNIKNFTDILKGDFTFLTSFTVPASASGDND